MSVRRFTSESYPDSERHAAWQDTLAALGLHAAAPAAAWGSHAAAVLRGAPDGITVARFVVDSQVVSPIVRQAAAPLARAPLVLVSLDGDASLDAGGERRPLRAGQVALLPRQGGARVAFGDGCRSLVLSAGDEAFRGRRIGTVFEALPRVMAAEGLAGVLAGSLRAAAEALDALSDPEWNAVEAGLAELLLALLRGSAASGPEANVGTVGATAATAAQAALLHRIHQSIERRLGDPDLTPGRAAGALGISERYLHRLFEGTGNSFAHTLRERRLLRSRLDLANPAEAHQSVSEIAFRCGFTDAAHFSRAFRDRFGLSPRAFRQGRPNARGGPRTPACSGAGRRMQPFRRASGARRSMLRPIRGALRSPPRRHPAITTSPSRPSTSTGASSAAR